MFTQPDKKIKIHYIANSNSAPLKAFKEYVATLFPHVCLEPYSMNTLPQVPTLLIFKPIVVETDDGEKYCSVSGIWHRYFSKHAPDTKLLSIGYAANSKRHSNYLDLLQLKDLDLDDYLEKARPVSAFCIYQDRKTGKYIDKWAGTGECNCCEGEPSPNCNSSHSTMPLRGTHIINRLKRFLDGHDTRKGFAKHLNDFNISIEVVRYKISGDEGESIEEQRDFLKKYVLPEYKKLSTRWEHYRQFFNFTPFKKDAEILNDTLKEINQHIQILGAELNLEVPMSTKSTEAITCIAQSLKKIKEIIEKIFPLVFEKEFCANQ